MMLIFCQEVQPSNKWNIMKQMKIMAVSAKQNVDAEMGKLDLAELTATEENLQ